MMGSDEAEIKHLERGQLDALIDAQNEIFSDYIIPMKSTRDFFLDFQRSVGGDLRNVLVATVGGEIVGYVNPVIDGREGWIGGVGVTPAMRRRGLGRKLMNSAEELFRSRGVRDIYLEVVEGNDRAQALYERLGYVAMRKFVTAEGKPAKFEGFGITPRRADVSEIIPLHERSYKNTCWQRRKTEAIVESSRGADCFVTSGGFVLVRTIDTSGFIPFLGVIPEKREAGVGTSLAKFALSRLWDLGAFKVAVYNVNEDLPTLRMLDKFDFKITMKQTEMKKQIG
jgi:ribosomal protein S18 acetylase RimI-like enzyme